MIQTETAVQLGAKPNRGKQWLAVSDPLEKEEESTHRMTLDVDADDYAWFCALAVYRNTLAELTGRKLRRLWTAKAVAESMVSIGRQGVATQMAELFAQLGPIPSAEDEEAIRAYAKRVVALDKKLSK